MQREEFLKKTPTNNASEIKVGIVLAEFNPDITEKMLEGALAVLEEWQVQEQNIEIYRVHGAFDITFACTRMIKKYQPQAIITLGCIIKGDTEHDRYIATAVTQGITNLTIKHDLPISLGILTTNTLAQAKVRSQGKTNHGASAAIAALQGAVL